MYLKAISLFALMGSAVAVPCASGKCKRDVTAITGAMTKVQAALADLDTTIKSITASSSPEALVGKSKAVTAALDAGTTSVSAQEPITLADALQVQGAATKLATATTTTIDDLIAKQAVITQAKQAQTALTQLQAQKAAAQKFAAAIVSKVPKAVQQIATQSAGSITAAIDKGVTAFGSGSATAGGAGDPAAGNMEGMEGMAGMEAGAGGVLQRVARKSSEPGRMRFDPESVSDLE